MRHFLLEFIMVVKKTQRLIKEYPSHTVFFSLLTMISIGMLLLALPWSRHVSMNFIDLFFIATSLTTVTGLTTIPFHDFTIFGQIVMLLLMQIGGLGLIVMSLMIMHILIDFGLYTKILTTEISSIQSFKQTKHMLLFIIKLTFLCEIIGALATFCIIRNDYPIGRALFLSLFHAVSSFCNVGVSLFHKNTLLYSTNIFMLITTTLLILLGGLGFFILHEFFNYIQKWRNHQKHDLSWHTKLILRFFFTTAIISGLLIWLLERDNTLQNLTSLQTFFNMILISISTKSAGHLPIAITCVHPATILLLATIAFIGSAPSSTGGGIKIGAFVIFLAVMQSIGKGASHVEINGKSIAKDQIYKAMTIIALSCLWIIIVLFCLLITESNHETITIVYETISAFSNNGTSLGLTPLLSVYGKILIIATMIIGRIGALTLIIGIRRASDLSEDDHKQPRIILD